MKVEHMNHDKSGDFRLVNESNNEVVGKMTYLWENEDVMIIEHTEIDPEFQGKNLGEKLVEAAVDYVRKTDKKIIPLCPFANAVFRRRTEYSDVLTTNE
ncbi:GNAT family N-acetyltransferase [Gynurincola endophyticus]|jgi:predicted GNAT family acetyltransferase|uniref:GNAT family N-acetyltransferase n=1 Tax=Gynurincola endophyticus TaxID=2479004 RepID=UPI0018F3E551|nr:GNAT family N-acetyltransferase [Gynurincola endophyticus]